MEHGRLPDGLTLQRSTDVFTDESVPDGLRRAHRVATGVWGRLRVLDGALRFVWEPTQPTDVGGIGHVDGGIDVAEPVELVAGDSVVIPPDTPHRVEPAPGCRFLVEFHR